jgi:hypothetical protein
VTTNGSELNTSDNASPSVASPVLSKSPRQAIPITNAQCHAWAQTLSPQTRLWGDVILFAVLGGLLVLVLL